MSDGIFRGGRVLAWLENAIREREDAANRVLGSGAAGGVESLRRCAADRALLSLHGGRAHSCPTLDYDGDYDGQARFYDHEICPVVLGLAEGYGVPPH